LDFLTVKILQKYAYRIAFALASIAAFFIIWMNLAVGIIGEPDNPANLMYVAVLAIGALGAIISRFKPHGMARAMFASAFAQALVAIVAVPAGMQPFIGLIIINWIFVTLFAASGWMFRQAAEIERIRSL
jgi:hypothetical protein